MNKGILYNETYQTRHKYLKEQNVISVYIVLILGILQRFSQRLVGAFCPGELFSQQLIAGLQSANLALLLNKSREDTERERGKNILIAAIRGKAVLFYISLLM